MGVWENCALSSLSRDGPWDSIKTEAKNALNALF